MSAETKFTPGPWEVKQGDDPRDFIVAERSGNTVAEPNCELFNDWPELDPSVRHIGVDEAKANAYLIAAAPNLYSALEKLIEKADSFTQDAVADRIRFQRDAAHVIRNAMAAARAALRRARGEQS